MKNPFFFAWITDIGGKVRKGWVASFNLGGVDQWGWQRFAIKVEWHFKL